MAKVAFLGLGVMGYPMAGHLKTKGGHDVTVYNRTPAKAEKWVAQFGGKSFEHLGAPCNQQAIDAGRRQMPCEFGAEPFGCSGNDIQKPFESEPAATLSR